MMKFRKYLFTMGIIFLATLFSGSSLFGQDIKIGWVNSIRILNEYKEAVEVQKRIDAERQKIQNELRDIQDQFERKSKELENQSLLLSDERKMEMQKELEALYLKGQQLQAQKLGPEGELVKRQDQLMQPIIEKIQEIINKIAKDEDYDWVFDSANGVILYVKEQEKTDLTQKIIDELNKGA